MKISVNWLKEFCPIDIPLTSLVEKLTIAGIEVEGTTQTDDGSDTIMELGITPNRADCLSVIGIAREVAAVCSYTLKPVICKTDEGEKNISSKITVSNDAPQKCLRYCARVVEGVSIGPSPQWLQDRLTSIDIKTINNVVDITNLVMIEMGHPIHAFDYNTVEGKKIVVRMADAGEKFISLDKSEYALSADMLVIADTKKPIALAGIVGGANTEISSHTTAVLLEAAYFEPVCIRKTAQKLSVHTESSHRFERGVDFCCIPKVIDYAASLILKLAGGTVLKGVDDNFSEMPKKKKIKLRIDRVNKLLGIQINKSQVKKYLSGLSFGCDLAEDGDTATFSVTVPMYRCDITREIDLIEEVARMHGYKNIPSILPYCQIAIFSQDYFRKTQKRIKDILSVKGFHEVYNYSFVSDTILEGKGSGGEDNWFAGPLKQVIQLKNPLTNESNVMRTTLIPGIIKTVSQNIKKGNSDILLFEMGTVFFGKTEDNRLVLTASKSKDKDLWNKGDNNRSFYDIKGMLDLILSAMYKDRFTFSPMSCSYFTGACSAQITGKKGETLGVIGEISSQVCESFGINDSLYVFEISLDKCIQEDYPHSTYKSLPKYPGVVRDAAFIVDRKMQSEDIVRHIKGGQPQLLKEVKIFDLYTGKSIPPNKKSVGYSFCYRSDNKTLTENEVDRVHEEIINRLKESLGVTFRDS